MSEAPERIVARADYDGEIDGQWIDAYAPRPHSFGHYYTEYVRGDLFAAVEADRDALEARLRAELAEARESAQSALTPPDITAAAARVLIPVFEEKHRDYMLSKGRNPDDYSSHFSMAVIDLRALAEVKP